VDGIVYVQVDVTPAYGLLEARWAAAQQPTAIVAWAPLEDGPVVRSYLDALVHVDSRIKGIRRLMQSESDPDFPLQLIDGLRLLPTYDLSFDICIREGQLARSIDMVRACPETQFVLDHMGKPGVQAHVLDPWRAEIEQMAALPTSVCKVSGIVTEADHEHWTPEDLAPYITHVLQAFGEERVLFRRRLAGGHARRELLAVGRNAERLQHQSEVVECQRAARLSTNRVMRRSASPGRRRAPSAPTIHRQ